MKKAKKIMAAVAAAITMVVSVSSLTVNADVYRSFEVGSEYATANAYRGSSAASAGTSLKNAYCGVTVIYAGKSDSATGTSSCYASVSGYGSSATSTHTASKGGYSGSTYMSF